MVDHPFYYDSLHSLDILGISQEPDFDTYTENKIQLFDDDSFDPVKEYTEQPDGDPTKIELLLNITSFEHHSNAYFLYENLFLKFPSEYHDILKSIISLIAFTSIRFSETDSFDMKEYAENFKVNKNEILSYFNRYSYAIDNFTTADWHIGMLLSDTNIHWFEDILEKDEFVIGFKVLFNRKFTEKEFYTYRNYIIDWLYNELAIFIPTNLLYNDYETDTIYEWTYG